MNPSLEIIYQDSDIVAINKPAGLLVHRSRIDPHASKFAVQQLRDQLGVLVYLVHRIDRPTSGVLLFGLNSEIARELSDQFANRIIKKHYRAIVRGFTREHGLWDEALKEKHDSISDLRAKPDKAAQNAVTEYFSIRNWEIPYSAGKYATSRYSEVDISPRTGRKHQIRRHFNHFAHPIIGDSTYGDRRHNRLFREHLGVSRLLLVAYQLEFFHPVQQRKIKLRAPIGSEFELALEQLDRLAIA